MQIQEPIFWKDQYVEFPKRFTETDLGDGFTQIEKAPGEVIQAGTPINEKYLNMMDQRALMAIWMAQENAEYIKKLMQKAEGLEGEQIQVELNNTLAYPFNNSKTTIPLSTNRNTKDYTVIVEVLEYSGGGVGDVEISDKLLNGFKIAFTGAASYVKANCIIQGGI